MNSFSLHARLLQRFPSLRGNFPERALHSHQLNAHSVEQVLHKRNESGSYSYTQTVSYPKATLPHFQRLWELLGVQVQVHRAG